LIIREILAQARSLLEDQAEGRLESEILLVDVLGVDRPYLYANPDQEVTQTQAEAFLDLVHSRVAGEPIAYLTGIREFWSLSLRVTPAVLIPRPETELLVETALELIPADARWRIADLGTGSGAIALAIASERPGCEVHATEYSRAACEVARQNIEALAPGSIELHQGSWLAPLEGRFRLIVSNPPYIAADDKHLQQGDCRFEPAGALTPGRDALAAIRHIAMSAREYLDNSGTLALEHGYHQGSEVRQILMEAAYQDVLTRDDLAGQERVTTGNWQR
jgi:release factor glutamine methyltransferase